jgi:Caspase domain
MRSVRILIAALVFFGGYGFCCAQTFHVISIADSADRRIGTGAGANSRKIHDYALLVSGLTNLQLDFNEINGKNYTCDAVRKAVADLTVRSNDVVLLYYSGHGISPQSVNPSGSTFPSFVCDDGPTNAEALKALPNLQALGHELKAKGARLTLAVADTCNVLQAVPEPEVPTRGADADQIRAMFLNFRGLILMSSSKTGEFSWYQYEGGLFTTRFLELLKNPPPAPATRLWDSVIAAATTAFPVTSDGVTVIQSPQQVVEGLKLISN